MDEDSSAGTVPADHDDCSQKTHRCMKISSFMPSEARREWSKVHVDPVIPCMTFLLSLMVGYGIQTAGYLAGSKWFTWHAHVTGMMHLVVTPVFLVGMRLDGPAFPKTCTYIIAASVMAPLSTVAAGMALVRPLHYAMFSSRLKTLTAFGVAVFFQIPAASVGPASAPAEPHRTLNVRLLFTADTTMHCTNSLTDLSMVRIILDQLLSFSWSSSHHHTVLLSAQVQGNLA